MYVPSSAPSLDQMGDRLYDWVVSNGSKAANERLRVLRDLAYEPERVGRNNRSAVAEALQVEDAQVSSVVQLLARQMIERTIDYLESVRGEIPQALLDSAGRNISTRHGQNQGRLAEVQARMPERDTTMTLDSILWTADPFGTQGGHPGDVARAAAVDRTRIAVAQTIPVELLANGSLQIPAVSLDAVISAAQAAERDGYMIRVGGEWCGGEQIREESLARWRGEHWTLSPKEMLPVTVAKGWSEIGMCFYPDPKRPDLLRATFNPPEELAGAKLEALRFVQSVCAGVPK
jgi:hypothetical protein